MARRTILVVEDDRDIRTTLKEVLEIEGFDVVPVANGREAFDRLKNGLLPSLILLDLMMPVMNGLEFLEARRADPEIARVPVIVVSATGGNLSSAKAQGFMKKPVEVDDLLRMIRQHRS